MRSDSDEDEMDEMNATVDDETEVETSQVSAMRCKDREQ